MLSAEPSGFQLTGIPLSPGASMFPPRTVVDGHDRLVTSAWSAAADGEAHADHAAERRSVGGICHCRSRDEDRPHPCHKRKRE
jgi:hypothetical protein